MTVNRLLKSEITKYLAPSYPGEIHVLDLCASTNDEAKKYAKANSPHGTAVFSLSQSNGRGRLGRSFLSPEGGIYVSIILKLTSAQIVFVTTAAAVGVCRAIESCSAVKPEIKWVNDIFVDGKKVCGILAERISDDTVILGVGMNYTSAPDVEGAGALFCPTADVPAPEINFFAAVLLAKLTEICCDENSSEFLNEYRRHSCVLGKAVRFFENGVWYEAKAVDIDKTGGLVVWVNETRRVLCCGEITLRVK